MIREVIRQQLGFLSRDLGIIDTIERKHPGCLKEAIPVLKPGENAISWSGNVTSVAIHPDWRWL